MSDDRHIKEVRISTARDGCYTLIGKRSDMEGVEISIKIYRTGISTYSRYNEDTESVILRSGSPSAYDLVQTWLNKGGNEHHFTYDSGRVLSYSRSPLSDPEDDAGIVRSIDFSQDGPRLTISRTLLVDRADSLMRLEEYASDVADTLLPNLLSEMQQTRALLERTRPESCTRWPRFWGLFAKN